MSGVSYAPNSGQNKWRGKTTSPRGRGSPNTSRGAVGSSNPAPFGQSSLKKVGPPKTASPAGIPKKTNVGANFSTNSSGTPLAEFLKNSSAPPAPPAPPALRVPGPVKIVKKQPTNFSKPATSSSSSPSLPSNAKKNFNTAPVSSAGSSAAWSQSNLKKTGPPATIKAKKPSTLASSGPVTFGQSSLKKTPKTQTTPKSPVASFSSGGGATFEKKKETPTAPSLRGGKGEKSQSFGTSRALALRGDSSPSFSRPEPQKQPQFSKLKTTQTTTPFNASSAPQSFTPKSNGKLLKNFAAWNDEIPASSLSSDEEKSLVETSSSTSEASLTKLATNRFGDMYKIAETFAAKWQCTPLDMAVFFFCMAVFNNPKRAKKTAIHDKELILTGYVYARYAFAAYKGKQKRVLKVLPSLAPEDYITGNWDKNVLGLAPAWFLVVDRDQKTVVLSLRGTKQFEDILVDLDASFVSWRNGYVHQGFLSSLEQLEPFVTQPVTNQMKNNPGYSLRIVGHSMGAAVSALLVLKWAEKYPQWKVRGYGYATPCCISGSLLQESRGIFVTFVHHFDAIARISLGSLDNLKNGMHMFSQRLGGKTNVWEIFNALQAISMNANTATMLAIAGEVDQQIHKNLSLQLQGQAKATHLFPAGVTYQFWRERRGKHFKAWELYRSETHDYSQLLFSPTMLKDHSSAAYRDAFENLLTIDVIEYSVWLSLKPSHSAMVKAYWEKYSNVEMTTVKPFNSAPILKELSRTSKYSEKALKYGLIRPFLFLVSMSPQRRAAMAEMMGFSLVRENWYTVKFCPHKESWYILHSHRKGVQARTHHRLNPLAAPADWYTVLTSCGKLVSKSQEDHISPDIRSLFKDCSKSNSGGEQVLTKLEEIVMLIFYDLSNQSAPDSLQKFNRSKSAPAVLSTPQHTNQSRDLALRFSQLGFQSKEFIDVISIQSSQSEKKINEIYSWGTVFRQQNEKVSKKTMAGAAGFAAIGGAMIAAAPLTGAASIPVAAIPFGLCVGVGILAATKATPGGLVTIVVGCIQQRIALAYHNIKIESYYNSKSTGTK